MAQWNGYGSGATHETKVKVLEDSLRKAVQTFGLVPAEERESTAKAIRRLSERLLAARLKVIRARIAALAITNKHLEKLRSQEQEIQAEGVDGILIEFGVLERILNF